MDPKVRGKLLTTHGEGEGDDDDGEGLRDGSPSGGAPDQAPRWDLHGNRSYGGGIRVFSLCMEFLGYVGIYRKKEGTQGAPPPLRTGFPSPDLILTFPERDFLQKYLSRRFHSVWTPFDIPFLQNPEIGKKNSNLDWAF